MFSNGLVQIDNIGPIICFANYSVLFGYNPPHNILKAFKKNNYTFVPITDINMFSSYQNLDELNSELISTIYGLSIYIRSSKLKESIGLIYIIFYCQQGYYNFIQIYNNKIRNLVANKDNNIIFDFEDFINIKNNCGFYVLIGCTKSILSNVVDKYLDDIERINIFIEECKKVFKNNLIWIANKLNIEEKKYLNLLLQTEKENIIYNYPIIHLDDFYYTNFEISPHIDMRAIHNHLDVKDLILKQDEYFKNEYFLDNRNNFVKKALESGIINNTYRFFNSLLTYKFKLDLSDYTRSYDIQHSREIVLDYAYNNFIKFISNKLDKIDSKDEIVHVGDMYFKRLISEIHSYDRIQHLQIYQMLFVVCKFVNYSRKNNIFIGPGRGSCVGSLLIYMLNITSIDPVFHKLIFERFINLSRLSNPDIDIDVSKDQRNLLLKEIADMFKDKYNNKNLIHIIVFSKFIFKMMVKDLIRVSSNNIKFVELNNMLKIYDNYESLYNFLSYIRNLNVCFLQLVEHISNSSASNMNISLLYSIFCLIVKNNNNIFLIKKHSIKEILNELSSTNNVSILNPLYDKVIKLINLLEDISKYNYCIKNTGIHAAGVLIGGENFINKIPLYFGSNADGNIVLCTHFDMDMLSKIQAIKFDILGLDNLSIIDHFCKEINVYFDEEEIFENFIKENKVAQNVYNMISAGATRNVFQLDKMHVSKICNKLNISKFEDIVALNSLNRPGASDTINNYINNKNGINFETLGCIEKYYFSAAPETHGVIIYQEQIMRLVKITAKYSDSEADVFREIVSKKKKELLDSEKVKFIARCYNNGISKETANEIFYRIEKFSGYAFNKSHAVAYSKITAITAYLKFHEYIKFNLICIIHKFDKTQKVIENLSEIIINTNLWIKILSYKASKNIVYTYKGNISNENFISVRSLDMIKICIPAFLIKGVSVEDINNVIEQSKSLSLIDLISITSISKAKLKILNNLGFFEHIIDIDKLYSDISNKKIIHKFNSILYDKISNNNNNIQTYKLSDLDCFVLDKTSIDYIGFSLVRANIILIIKYFIKALEKHKDITLNAKKVLENNIFFVYKIFDKEISIIRINSFITYKNFKTSYNINIFDVLLTDRKNTSVIYNITQSIIEQNSFSILFKLAEQVEIKNIDDIYITYCDRISEYKLSLKSNFKDLYSLLEKYFIKDITIV